MYELFATYFRVSGRVQFEADLAGKHAVILLRDSCTGEIQGFSTLLEIDAQIDGQPVTAFFSGDTIIARDYWGESALGRVWLRHVFDRTDGPLAEAGRRFYWFLISSGYKTFRFLPLFFHRYYPNPMRDAWPLERARDVFARQMFGDRFDAARGVVRLAHPTPLHAGVADLSAERLRDPNVQFFAACNPGHIEGDELACIAEICRENLTRAGRRWLGGRLE